MKLHEATIEADAEVPVIHIYRDFAGTPSQLIRAHLDPALFSRWVGPHGTEIRIDYWTAKTGGSWRYVGNLGEAEFAFRGCFHSVGVDRFVQTFTWEGQPDDVALETFEFTDAGDGVTRMHAWSLCESFEIRDGWLKSGMETGVNDGYDKLDRMLVDGLS